MSDNSEKNEGGDMITLLKMLSKKRILGWVGGWCWFWVYPN